MSNEHALDIVGGRKEEGRRVYVWLGESTFQEGQLEGEREAFRDICWNATALTHWQVYLTTY